MKIKFIWFITLAITLGSCQEKDMITILSGKLPNQKGNTIILVPVDEYFPGLVNNREYISTQVDSSGRFTFKNKQITSGIYQILQGNYHQLKYDVFLERGDSIYIEQSSWSDTPQLKISGNGADKLNFLLTDYKIFPKDRSFYDTIRSNAFSTELLFKDYIDSIFSKRINEVNINKSIPKKLKSYFLKSINGEKAMFLLEHLERRNYYMNDEFDYFHPDTSYYSFLENLQFDDEFCQSTASKELANVYLQNKARFTFKEDDDEKWWDENLLWKLNYIVNSPKSKWTDLLAISTIQEYSFGLMQDDFFQNLTIFKNKMDTLFYSDINRKLFLSNISEFQILAPGKPAPNFELPDSNGVNHRISDFKGKIVYIDFWGTWCYPCIQEIPAALELQEKYKNMPIVFLYIALEYDNENIANWKKFIAGQDERFGKFLKNKPFPGIHLVAEKQFRNENIKSYKINFAPTYVLLDQNGNIVSSRAKRPKDISDSIDKLINAM